MYNNVKQQREVFSIVIIHNRNVINKEVVSITGEFNTYLDILVTTVHTECALITTDKQTCLFY